MLSFENIKKRLASSNQQHLLMFWEYLNEDEQKRYLEQLNNINFDEVNELFNRSQESLNEDVEKLDSRMKPVPETQFESEVGISEEKLENYRRNGLEEISNGRVGVLLMAGGQGTRLGVTYPKGMYSVGLPSRKTLFQLQAERIKRIQKLAEEQTGTFGDIPWYIMTSGPTDEATENFLKNHNYFGLDPNNVILFKQGLLPCFDFNGKILLERKDQIALAPDGNGGIYRALEINGILDDMERRGVSYLHVHSVDNILVKVADPVFVGYCVEKNADCGAKVVKKVGPSEAVGVVCQVDGRFQVVEYSEITEATANLRDSAGNLVFSAGNICNHFFKTKFLREIANNHENKLKLHVAKKKIPYVNDKGETIKPVTPNGIKIEKFVFDVFQFSNDFVTWEVPRESEFSALKNSDEAGKDCPSTARCDLLALHKIYIEKSGGKVCGDEIEISPMLSYSGENLKNKVEGKILESPLHLTPDDETEINGH